MLAVIPLKDGLGDPLQGFPLAPIHLTLLFLRVHPRSGSHIAGQSLYWLGIGWWRHGKDDFVTCQIAFLFWPPSLLDWLEE